MRKAFGVKYSNRAKVLLCYALAWGLALLLPYLALRYLYPYKLAGTAPAAATGLAFLPLPAAAREALALGQAAADRGLLKQALAARDLAWRYTVGGLAALAWLLTLLGQLGWRAAYVRPREGAGAALRAVHTSRWMLLGLAALNLLCALWLYLAAVRWIPDRTVWDALTYYSGFVLNTAAAAVCFRLAAPPAISGRRAYFKRL